MNARLLLLALWPALAEAQGFAGLGGSAEGYAVPERGAALAFPADDGAHPLFRIEWWYVTANLRDAEGTDYGVQWTLFRTALAPGGADESQLWMGHAALTTPDAHHVAERLGRGGTGQAGVTAEPFEAWIDEWRLTGPDEGVMTAQGEDWGYDLSLAAGGPRVLQGDAGFSVKSEDGQASFYYSQPFYAAEGTLHLPGGDVAVTGTAWLDREWSSQPLADRQTGWDWFALSFDDGARLMAFRLREGEGAFTSATWIAPDGTPTPYGDGALVAEPLETAEVEGREVPVRWRIALPPEGVDVTIGAVNPQAWMATSVPYWEGPVRIEGRPGRGYLEMTGY